MPELPEVETVRRDLEAAFVGSRIAEVEATGVRTLRRHPDRTDVVGRLRGRRLIRADRVGKYLVGHLDGGDAIVVHLGMSGQLRRHAPDDPVARHTHLVLRFVDPAAGEGSELRFVDPRTFGEVFVTRSGPGGVPLELAHLGPDPLGLTRVALAGRLAGRRTRLKPLLLDQRFVAGIGNMYADEILWAARLRANRPAGGLNPWDIGRLQRSARAVLLASVAARGSSLADLQYRDLSGRIGSYQDQHAVYGREGRPCPRCGRPVVRVREGGRSSFSCPRCQH